MEVILRKEQAIGPFLGGFIHTHTVIARDGGSQIDDSIEFEAWQHTKHASELGHVGARKPTKPTNYLSCGMRTTRRKPHPAPEPPPHTQRSMLQVSATSNAWDVPFPGTNLQAPHPPSRPAPPKISRTTLLHTCCM